MQSVLSVVADGTRSPFRPGSLDTVLVDAPCSGLGVMRRRPDARWRIQAADVERLATLQRRLLREAVTLVRPGGIVAYSVCTLTRAETAGIDTWLAGAFPGFRPLLNSARLPLWLIRVLVHRRSLARHSSAYWFGPGISRDAASSAWIASVRSR